MSMNMPIQGESECRRLEEAFWQAMKVFDASTTRLLISEMEDKYGIHIGMPPCSSAEEIEKALIKITDVGPDLIISRMREFLR